MSSATFNASVGGDGSTVTDDSSPTTGLANGGHRTRFVPALAQLVAVAAFVVNKANQFFSANGITGTSVTSLTVGTGSKSLTIETGKSFVAGQPIRISAQSGPENIWMQGAVTSYDSGTGALLVNVTSTSGTGTLAAWTVFVISTLDVISTAFARTLLDDADAATARATLGAQPLDATITALAGLSTGPDKLPYSTGVDTFAETPFTPFARQLLDDVDAVTARATLGLTLGVNVQAFDATLTALAGLFTGPDKLPYSTGADTFAETDLTAFARTLLDDADAATARATLGLSGTVLQVVHATDTTVYALSVAVSAWTDTSIVASITPLRASSKILVIWSVAYQPYYASVGYNIPASMRIRRDAVYGGAGALHCIASGGETLTPSATLQLVDTPGVTTPVTYRLQAWAANNGTVYINGNYGAQQTLPANCILLEIAA